MAGCSAEPTAPPPISYLAEDPATDTITIVVVDCRGVMIGNNCRQYNDLRYRVEHPCIDLESLLLRSDVQAAFRRLMADPDNTSAWRDAIAALTSGQPSSWLRAAPLVPESLGDPTLRRGPRPETEVFVIGSRGVQIGSGGVQHTRFLYSVSPTLDAAALLASRPGLARALVDHLVGSGSETERTISLRLADAVRGAVLEAAGERTDSAVAVPSPGRGQLLRISACDAVAVDAGQRNTIRVTLDHPTRIMPDRRNVVPPSPAPPHRTVHRVPSARRAGGRMTPKPGDPYPRGRRGLGRG